jgi:hypothetical protein
MGVLRGASVTCRIVERNRVQGATDGSNYAIKTGRGFEGDSTTRRTGGAEEEFSNEEVSIPALTPEKQAG